MTSVRGQLTRLTAGAIAGLALMTMPGCAPTPVSPAAPSIPLSADKPSAPAPSSPTHASVPAQPSHQMAIPDAASLNGRWSVEQTAATEIVVPPDTRGLFIEFRADAKSVQGFAGCNTFRGSYETDGTKLTIGPLVTTKLACGPLPDKLEHELLKAFEKIRKFTIEENCLRLMCADGQVLVRAHGVEALKAIAENPANP